MHDLSVDLGTHSNGVFYLVIFFAAVLGLGVALERMFLLMRYQVNAAHLWQKVRDHLLNNRLTEATESCQKSAPLCRSLRAGLAHTAQSPEKVRHAVDAVLLEVVPELERRLRLLTLLANVALLAGVCGTLWSLWVAFMGVAVAEPTQKAAILASSVSTALSPLAAGLVAALTLLLLYSVAQAKVGRILDDVVEFSTKLVRLSEGNLAK